MSFKDYLREYEWDKDERTKAYREGYSAGNRDHGIKSTSDNPYKKGTPEFKQWLEGFNEAAYNCGPYGT
jgi:hypothetical protein